MVVIQLFLWLNLKGQGVNPQGCIQQWLSSIDLYRQLKAMDKGFKLQSLGQQLSAVSSWKCACLKANCRSTICGVGYVVKYVWWCACYLMMIWWYVQCSFRRVIDVWCILFINHWYVLLFIVHCLWYWSSHSPLRFSLCCSSAMFEIYGECC